MAAGKDFWEGGNQGPTLVASLPQRPYFQYLTQDLKLLGKQNQFPPLEVFEKEFYKDMWYDKIIKIQ